MNGTPKKNGSSNGKGIGNLIENKDASPPIPNLRLEAKMTAEVSYLATMNSRKKKVFIYIYIYIFFMHFLHVGLAVINW
jgi:hypothetical protein